MVVHLTLAMPGSTEPSQAFVAQHAHSSLALHPSSSAAHAEETASVDWPDVLPAKGAGFLAFALKGFALRLQEDGTLRAYLPQALLPALAAGGYRIDDAVLDADGNIVGGILHYRPKLRRVLKRDAAAQAALERAADASVDAMRTLHEHKGKGAVQPLPLADMRVLRRRVAEVHPGVKILEIVEADDTTLALARAHQLASRTAWHAGAAGEATAHLRAAQAAANATIAITTPGKRRRGAGKGKGKGKDEDDGLAQLLTRLNDLTQRELEEAAIRRMWSLLDADYMWDTWDNAQWLTYAKGTRDQQVKLVESVFMPHKSGGRKYAAAKAAGRTTLAALAAEQPAFVEHLLRAAAAQDGSYNGPGGPSARLVALNCFSRARKRVLKAGKRVSPELAAVLDTGLDALPYAQVVSLALVLMQAAEDYGTLPSDWRDSVLAVLSRAGCEDAEPARKRPRTE